VEAKLLKGKTAAIVVWSQTSSHSRDEPIVVHIRNE